MKKLISVLILLSGVHSFAATVGPAGCGLGNMMMGGKDSQILVATTNGTGSQWSAILSGTSGCVDSAGVAKLEAYVEANRLALANDAARGQGETLSGLSQVLRCQNSSAVGRVLQQNYEGIFSGEEAAGVISGRIREALIKESPVTVYCPGLS